jgi:ATP-dependent protease ClpP protease subunit
MRALQGRNVLNLLPTSGEWFRFTNKAADTAEVWIYDDIGFFGVTAADFARELADVTAPRITVHLSSLGGDVFDGIAIYNSLRMHDAAINVQVDSMAASIASVIAQAGDTRTMMTGSQMMIHDAWGISAGTADDMRQYADILDKQTANIAAIYAERAGDGRKKPHYRALMRDETWMSPEEAINEGLADAIIKPPTNAEDEESVTVGAPVDWSDFIESATTIGA